MKHSTFTTVCELFSIVYLMSGMLSMIGFTIPFIEASRLNADYSPDGWSYFNLAFGVIDIALSMTLFVVKGLKIKQ